MAEEEIFQFEEAFPPNRSASSASSPPPASSDNFQLLSSKGLTTLIDCDRTVVSSTSTPSASAVDRIATSITIPATSTTGKRPPVRPVSLELGPRNEGATSCVRTEAVAATGSNNNNSRTLNNNESYIGSNIGNASYNNTSPTGSASKNTGSRQ